MATFTTFVCWSLMNHGLSFWAAFPIVLAIAFFGGIAIERTLIRPVENASVLTIVIVTLGLALALNGLMSLIWGGANRQFDGPFSSQDDRRRRGPGQRPGHRHRRRAVRARRTARTFLPLHEARSRAYARQPSTLPRHVSSACASGWMLALGWGLAAVLGAVAGMMVALVVFLDPNMMQTILLTRSPWRAWRS